MLVKAKYKTSVSFALLSLILSGCTTMPVANIQALPIPADDHVAMIDQRTSPNAGGFLSAEGNIFSCHYAIHQVAAGSLNPNRMDLLHAYLSNKVFSVGSANTVVVTRFDIYVNRHKVAGHGATTAAFAGILGGAVGGAIAGAAEGKPTNEKAPVPKNEDPVVGCKSAGEGEYLLSESPYTQSSPVVIYLNANVDGKSYSVRTVYTWGAPDYIETWPVAIAAALSQTFATLGADIHGGNQAANATSNSQSRM